MEVKFEDNTRKFLEALSEDAVPRTLTRIGMQAEGYAKDLCPVNTGRLRNSIAFQTDERTRSVIIGTNVSYGITVETGAKPSKKKDPSEAGSENDKPNPHPTSLPSPFLKPAIANHMLTYLNIIKDEIKNG